MSMKDSFICPYCGGVIPDDEQEYCVWCGADLREKQTAKSAGSGIGGIVIFGILLLVIILLITKK